MSVAKMTEMDDFERYRRQIPAIQKYIYMNSAGCGPMPVPVLRSMETVFEKMTEEGQVNPGIHKWLKELLEDVRREIAAFIHADPEEIFFTRCIAEGLNTIIHMFSWQEGDRILTSDQENPASILPCYTAEKIFGTETDMFRGIGNREQLLCQFRESITKDTKMAIFSHVFHTNGTALPAEEICRLAENRQVITVVDGAQAAGNIPIDVKKMGCSFYLLSCHKWLCGPEGIAAVYVRKNLLAELRVPFGGVGMQKSFDAETHEMEYQPDARRFEYGGRHIPMYAAFREAIRFSGEIGSDCIRKRTRELHRYCRKKVESLGNRVEILSPADERLQTAIFAFRIPGRNHQELVKRAWREEKIIIQWRIVNLETKEEGLRISLNWFIREKDIDLLISFVRRILEEET